MTARISLIAIALTASIIADLKAQHGEDNVRKFQLERGGQEFVVRGPAPGEYERALDKIGDGGRRKTEAIQEVGLACIVFPDRETVDAILVTKPGLKLTAGNVALEISGVVEAYAEKI